MIFIRRSILSSIAPHALPDYLRAFDDADTILAPYSINATKLRVSHFLAQCLHETGGFTIMTESLNYSPEGLMSTFGAKRISLHDAMKYGRTADHPADQRAVANIVYGGEFGRANLGNTEPDDGWNYRGAGLLQNTGRYSRAHAGSLLGLDLIDHPELAIDPAHMLAIAAVEWNEKKCNIFADRDDLRGVTKKINGGEIGLSDRAPWLTKVKRVFGIAS